MKMTALLSSRSVALLHLDSQLSLINQFISKWTFIGPRTESWVIGRRTEPSWADLSVLGGVR